MVFVAGSAFAALSISAGLLTAARVVQGVGGAMILPSTLSTTNAIFRGEDRAAAFDVWGAVMSGAAAVGPLAGGLITEYISWQWIFWINVPLGLALVALALRFVPNTSVATAEGYESGERDGRGADLRGLLLSMLSFGGLVFGIIEGLGASPGQDDHRARCRARRPGVGCVRRAAAGRRGAR